MSIEPSVATISSIPPIVSDSPETADSLRTRTEAAAATALRVQPTTSTPPTGPKSILRTLGTGSNGHRVTFNTKLHRIESPESNASVVSTDSLDECFETEKEKRDFFWR